MKICTTLCIAKSGYYRWKKSPVSKYDLLNKELIETIKLIHEKSRKYFGSPRITVKLKEADYKCNHKIVERPMKVNGIKSTAKKKFRITTDSNHKSTISPNRVQREHL